MTIVASTNIFAAATKKDRTFFAEALLWQIRESNSTNWAQILEPANSNETIEFLNVPFKWNTGIRVGAGFNLKESPYDILFYYTGYKTRGTNQGSTTTGQLHSAFSGNFYANNQQGNGVTGPYYQRANITWDVYYNTLDLELGRIFNMGKIVDFHPALGLKAGTINHTIKSGWFDPPAGQGPITPTFTSATENISNDFKGIGPSLGLDANFHLYTAPSYAINLIGKFSGALLWGTWKFSDIYQNNTPQTIATESDDITSTAAMVRGYLGIGWSIFSTRANWNLQLGYEQQAWFNQLQYYSFDMGKTNDTLYLGGAVFSLDVDF